MGQDSFELGFFGSLDKLGTGKFGTKEAKNVK